MIHDRAMGSLNALCLILIGQALAACAGSERPQPSEELEDQISAVYVNGAGVAGRGGAGGGSSGGAGGSAQANGGTAGSGACEPLVILQTSCNGTSCHGAGTDIGNFAESLPDAESFNGAEPVTAECAEITPPLVVLDPENPAQSLLIRKVNGGTPPCGNPMPLGPAPLTNDEIDCLVQWIGDL
jgi:hypothetical protein